MERPGGIVPEGARHRLRWTQGADRRGLPSRRAIPRRLLSASQFGPDAAIFAELENNIFGLGTMVAACPGRLKDYIDLVTRTRSLLKRQSESWDMNDRAARDRLYRLIYGGRAALEEVMLQAPAGSYPALILADQVPSVTPSYTLPRFAASQR